MSNQQQSEKSESSTPPVFFDGHGGSITILEEGSATTPMRYRMVLPQGLGPPPERHLNQTEEVRVISGVLGLGSVNGQRIELRAGQTFSLPVATYHRPQNTHPEPAEFEATLTPGLGSAAMFRSIYSTVRMRRGLGFAMRMALIVDRHRTEIEFTPPVRISLRVLAPVARLLGVRAD
jgi:quercetin dioxygenase-like cupin family protein